MRRAIGWEVQSATSPRRPDDCVGTRACDPIALPSMLLGPSLGAVRTQVGKRIETVASSASSGTMVAVNVLLVEDDRRLADLLVERLRDEGHDAETAATGTDGLDRALHGSFDVAVVDVMLPGLDGLELTRSLRRRSVGVPVLMLTARDAIEDR